MSNAEYLPTLPIQTSTLKRKVTQQDLDSCPLLGRNYSDNSNAFYSKPVENVQSTDSGSNQPTYHRDCDFMFQSNLSSLSKEETSSEDFDDSGINNKDSIFRLKQREREENTTVARRDDVETRNDSMPNLSRDSNLDYSKRTIDGHHYYQEQPNDNNNHDQEPNNLKSFDYSIDETYTPDLATNQSRKRSRTSPEQGNVNGLNKKPMPPLMRNDIHNNSSHQDLGKRTTKGRNSCEFYRVLESNKKAFTDFSFLLPGLKPHVPRDSHKSTNFVNLVPTEVTAAKRRLKCAVNAFGGNMVSENSSQSYSTNLSSIFRNKDDEAPIAQDLKKDPAQIHYEKQMPLRYYENKTRLSWDEEEHPPVEGGVNNEYASNKHANYFHSRSKSNITKAPSLENEDSHRNLLKITNSRSHGNQEDGQNLEETPKTKYRCKLCGQPKQNHTCPYQQSLQRNIGTMSYPALNSYECAEPGKLAPSLADMNNFFNNFEETQNQPDSVLSFASFATQSESLDCDSFGHAIKNVISEGNTTMKEVCPSFNDASPSNDFTNSLRGKKRKIVIQSSFIKNPSDEFSKDSLILDKVEIKPEQYRVVSSKSKSTNGSYTYPTIPLTYSQRKCMSDSLYNLSKETSGLVDECSRILQEVKESESWDLAVAELITQVLVILHCPIGDKSLEGLQKYLQMVGFSC